MSSSAVERIERIKKLLSKGMSLYEIERELGLKPEELVRTLLSLKDAPRRVPKLDMYIYLHERGLTREEVMRVMRLSRGQYYSYRMKAIERRGYRFQRRTRLIELLEHLKEGNGVLSADQLSEKLGMKKPALYQLISRARKRGMVETCGKGDTYRVILSKA